MRNGKESDVYSYGVVLLELIAWKRVLDPLFTVDKDMVSWVRSTWDGSEAAIDIIADPGLVDEFIDPTIIQEVIAILLLAMRCASTDPNERPTMRDVVEQLPDVKGQVRIKHK
ncbi:hypothetical protein GIB67_019859 [Kingdonia uniflora]|uniref:Protein kinase domain-containing protein n=1 Tax=Kingdonia uniflora TaxID=39325 RepID=A0A7J7MKC2_9MAGN|nr:hypothetical protein GIB67_019859 [Kingdonia uniflora]